MRIRTVIGPGLQLHRHSFSDFRINKTCGSNRESGGDFCGRQYRTRCPDSADQAFQVDRSGVFSEAAVDSVDRSSGNSSPRRNAEIYSDPFVTTRESAFCWVKPSEVNQRLANVVDEIPKRPYVNRGRQHPCSGRPSESGRR